MSVAELMAATGKTKDQVYNAENGTSSLKDKDAQIYAKALGATVAEIMGEQETRLVPVKGYVGAGAEVFPFEGDDSHLDHVECPNGLDPDKTEAYIVRGDSMLPIEPDSLIYIMPGLKIDPLNKHCLVDLADGRRLFKSVRRGSSPRRFTLMSSNALPIEDVAIVRAARVEAIQKPRKS
jgi:phage repressor protein C with HTH and peptisase S24 domain